MIQSNPATSIPIPAEVTAFAAEQGVSAELPAVLAMTERVFPGAAVSVYLEDDPEIANDWHIIVDVKAKLTVPEATAASDRWCHGLFEVCPAPLTCVFRLGLGIG